MNQIILFNIILTEPKEFELEAAATLAQTPDNYNTLECWRKISDFRCSMYRRYRRNTKKRINDNFNRIKSCLDDIVTNDKHTNIAAETKGRDMKYIKEGTFTA